MAKRTAVVVRHKAPTVSKNKYENLVRLRSAAVKRAGQETKQRMGALAGVGACAAVGYLERNGKMPSFGGFEPTAVIGLALGFVLPAFVKGNAGRVLGEAGVAVAGVAAYKLGTGAPLRVGEDDSDD